LAQRCLREAASLRDGHEEAEEVQIHASTAGRVL
jgi:hypothetical protein